MSGKYSVSYCPGCGSDAIEKDASYLYQCPDCGGYWEVA